MTAKVKIFKTAEDVCGRVAALLAEMAVGGANIALSGGSTPKLLFRIMAERFAGVDWSKLRFFWGDERMVPADDKESNYGEFYRLLVATGVIPRESVFPFKYNVDEQQALKDAEALIGKIPFVDGLPRFDLIILGIGEDGHTASIFPGNLQSFESRRIVEIAVHPQTKQHRLTLTGSVINNAEDIIFLCTGASKKPVIDEIVNRKNRSLPASHVSASGSLFFYVDEAVVSR